MKTEVCNFSKTAAKASGAVGVLTYDVLESGKSEASERVAVMFSVPYDYNLYENWAAVGIYDVSKEVDEEMYKEMYYSREQEHFAREKGDGCCLKFEGKDLVVMCTMSPMGRAIMKVELWRKSDIM